MKNKILIIIGVIVLVLIMFNGKKEAGETLSRSLPSSAGVSTTFTLNYIVNNPDPPYFFSIVDSISGGCTVLGDTNIITTLTSPTTTLPLTVQAPSSAGTCAFTGDWQLGDGSPVDFTTQSVIISGSCSCGSWTDGSCGGGSCSSTQRQQTRTCTPSACNTETQCVTDAACGGSLSTLDRSVPSTASGSSSFTLNYIVQNPSAPYFFSIVDSISGGCTVAGDTSIVTTLTSPTTTMPITVNTPASGSCTFTGDWQLGDGPVTDFTSDTVTITSSTQTCSAQSGSCCSSGQTCVGGTYQASSDCSSLCCVGGTCTSPTQTCSAQSGDICTASESCSGNWLSASDSTRCCSVTCTTPEQTCEEINDCEIWEQCKDNGPDCELAGWVYLVIAFFVFMMFMSAMK